MEDMKKMYKMYGRVTETQDKLQGAADAPGEFVDSAEEKLKKKANDLFGLRRGDLKGRLTVFIRQANGLEGRDGLLHRGKIDPYVVIQIDGKELGRTSVCKNGGSDPVWNEVFTFDVNGTYEDLSFHILDKDLDDDDHLGVSVVSAKQIYKKRGVEGAFSVKKAKVEEIAQANGDDVELQPVKEGEKEPDSIGTLTFRVEYHPPRFEGKLEIEIKHANNLYNADGGGFFKRGVSDPYVKVLIDDKKVAKTRTVKNDLNPVWNETLHVAVTGEHTYIFLVVHDNDHTSCDECLGHLKINAAELMEKNEISATTQLVAKPGSDAEKEVGTNFGTLTYRIRHTPPALGGTIKCNVISASGLASLDGLFRGKSDPYVSLQVDGKEVAKTKTIDNTKNPEWNEELSFPVSGAAKIVSFVVMDFDDDSEDDHLGTVSFGAEQIIMDRTIQGKFILKPRQGEKSVKGNITLTLTYDPK
jgi:Ca2+-dependent lipid-binding protein